MSASVLSSAAPSLRRRSSRRPWVVGAIVVLAIGAALAAADFAAGVYQQRAAESRKERRQQVERMAWYALRADVAEVGYTADGKYRMTVWMENVFPEHDMYVMAPSIRAFVQIGPRWVEVPARGIAGDGVLAAGTVVNLKERRHAGATFEVAATDYFDLLPGYMHVKFDNTMYVSPEAQPKEDLVERLDNYYIHLRPFGADDERLQKLNRFPGPVPLWIGMPPH